MEAPTASLDEHNPVVLRSPYWETRRIKTEAGAAFFAGSAKWCTAGRNGNSYWGLYGPKAGDLFILRKIGGKQPSFQTFIRHSTGNVETQHRAKRSVGKADFLGTLCEDTRGFFKDLFERARKRQEKKREQLERAGAMRNTELPAVDPGFSNSEFIYRYHEALHSVSICSCTTDPTLTEPLAAYRMFVDMLRDSPPRGSYKEDKYFGAMILNASAVSHSQMRFQTFKEGHFQQRELHLETMGADVDISEAVRVVRREKLNVSNGELVTLHLNRSRSINFIGIAGRLHLADLHRKPGRYAYAMPPSMEVMKYIKPGDPIERISSFVVDGELMEIEIDIHSAFEGHQLRRSGL